MSDTTLLEIIETSQVFQLYRTSGTVSVVKMNSPLPVKPSSNLLCSKEAKIGKTSSTDTLCTMNKHNFPMLAAPNRPPSVLRRYTVLQMFTQFCLFLLKNAYVAEGRNKGGREATPTSISIFDFYDIKTL